MRSKGASWKPRLVLNLTLAGFAAFSAARSGTALRIAMQTRSNGSGLMDERLPESSRKRQRRIQAGLMPSMQGAGGLAFFVLISTRLQPGEPRRIICPSRFSGLMRFEKLLKQLSPKCAQHPAEAGC